jgi:hypothetical protein
MLARTLKDFFAGFFYGEIKADLKVKMVIAYKGQGNGDVKKIKVEGERDKGKGGNRSPRNCPPMERKVKWNWHEDFVREWNKTYLTKKKETNLK